MTDISLTELDAELKAALRPVCNSAAQVSAEAALILEYLLGLRPEDVLSRGDQAISGRQAEKIRNLLLQRVEKRIPVQYLLHQAWFYGLKFYVNPHVLIPRPETELLVEEALKAFKPGMRILEIGTGPGVVAMALSHKLGPDIAIVGTDISRDALKVARINQRQLGTHVDLRQGDLFEPVAGERFDLLLSNPPYVDPALKPVLDAEVLYHEPEVALFPPAEDPYFYYRRLTDEGKVHLNPGGWLMVETGAGMAKEIARIFEAAGYTNVRIIPDLAGIERIILGQIG